ncbi:unnamed protein product [Amoebophrya sp. A120]|nr:unnamed protein product [Amoebophrya sp. A120]|eukprot:GSA120T00002383001.1
MWRIFFAEIGGGQRGRYGFACAVQCFLLLLLGGGDPFLPKSAVLASRSKVPRIGADHDGENLPVSGGEAGSTSTSSAGGAALQRNDRVSKVEEAEELHVVDGQLLGADRLTRKLQEKRSTTTNMRTTTEQDVVQGPPSSHLQLKQEPPPEEGPDDRGIDTSSGTPFSSVLSPNSTLLAVGDHSPGSPARATRSDFTAGTAEESSGAAFSEQPPGEKKEGPPVMRAAAESTTTTRPSPVLADVFQRLRELERTVIQVQEQRKQDHKAFEDQRKRDQKAIDGRFLVARDVGSANEQFTQNLLAYALESTTDQYITAVVYLNLGFLSALVAIVLPLIRVLFPRRALGRRRQAASVVVPAGGNNDPAQDLSAEDEVAELRPVLILRDEELVPQEPDNQARSRRLQDVPDEEYYLFYPFDFVHMGTLSSIVQAVDTADGRIFAVCLIVTEVLFLLSRYTLTIYEPWCHPQDRKAPTGFPFMMSFGERLTRLLWLVLPRILLLLTAALPSNTDETRQARSLARRASGGTFSPVSSQRVGVDEHSTAAGGQDRAPLEQEEGGKMKNKKTASRAQLPVQRDASMTLPADTALRGQPDSVDRIAVLLHQAREGTKHHSSAMQALHVLAAPLSVVLLLFFETLQLVYGERINLVTALVGADEAQWEASIASDPSFADIHVAPWSFEDLLHPYQNEALFDGTNPLFRCSDVAPLAHLMQFPRLFQLRVFMLLAAWVLAVVFALANTLLVTLEWVALPKALFWRTGEGYWVREAQSLFFPKLTFLTELGAFLLVQGLPLVPLLQLYTGMGWRPNFGMHPGLVVIGDDTLAARVERSYNGMWDFFFQPCGTLWDYVALHDHCSASITADPYRKFWVTSLRNNINDTNTGYLGQTLLNGVDPRCETYAPHLRSC